MPKGFTASATPSDCRLAARNDARADVRDALPPGPRGARRSVAAPGLVDVAKDAPGLEAVVAHEKDDGKLGLAEMGGTLFKSVDGGQTWKFNNAADAIPGNLYQIEFFGPNTGFALGSDGVLLRYTGRA